MTQRAAPRRAMIVLLTGVLVLPIAAWAIVAVSALLAAMGDADGALWLRRLAWLTGALWAVDLVCLVVVHALSSLTDADQSDDPRL